eukprot:9857747-Alexandrium_andersonii.AAC.1
MSASLVGSEMCIRDRSGFAVRNECPEPFLRGGTLRSQIACVCVPRFGNCLLYTSDAADDM